MPTNAPQIRFSELNPSARFRSNGVLYEKIDERLAKEIRFNQDGSCESVTAFVFPEYEMVESVEYENL